MLPPHSPLLISVDWEFVEALSRERLGEWLLFSTAVYTRTDVSLGPPVQCSCMDLMFKLYYKQQLSFMLLFFQIFLPQGLNDIVGELWDCFCCSCYPSIWLLLQVCLEVLQNTLFIWWPVIRPSLCNSNKTNKNAPQRMYLHLPRLFSNLKTHKMQTF